MEVKLNPLGLMKGLNSHPKPAYNFTLVRLMFALLDLTRTCVI
jgi:hypothetical protein